MNARKQGYLANHFQADQTHRFHVHLLTWTSMYIVAEIGAPYMYKYDD